MSNKVEIEIGGNSRGFAAACGTARAHFAKLAADLGRSTFSQFLGANAVMSALSSIKAAFTEAMDEAEKFSNLNQSIGGGVEWLQKLDMAAKDSHTTIEKLQSTFGDLISAREAAINGDSAKLGAFASLGISAKDLSGMEGGSDIYKAVNQSVVAMGPSRDVIASLKELGFTMAQIPVIAKDLQQYQPFINSEAEIKEIQKLEDSTDNFKRSWKKTFIEIAASWGEVAGNLRARNKGADNPARLLNPFAWVEKIYGGDTQDMTVQQRFAAAAFKAKDAERSKSGQEDKAAKASADLNKRQLETAMAAERKVTDTINAEAQAERLRNATALERIDILREQLRLAIELQKNPGFSWDDVQRAEDALSVEKTKRELASAIGGLGEDDRKSFATNERLKLRGALIANQEYARQIQIGSTRQVEGMPGDVRRSELAKLRVENAGIQRQTDYVTAAERGRDIRPVNSFDVSEADIAAMTPDIIATVDSILAGSKNTQGNAGLDQLAQIGGFVGGASTSIGNPQLQVQREQLDVTRKMADDIATIARRPSGTGDTWQ